jgi:hypothetical protein
MHFSLIALAGLTALGNNLAQARVATTNDLVQSSSLRVRDAAAFLEDNFKRGLDSVLPRNPVVIPPKPIKPPVTPDGPSPPVKPPPGRDGPDGPGGKPDPLAPAPIRDPAVGPVCVLKAKRSRIYGRATYTKADAEDPAKVLEWMNENKAWFEAENIQKDKIVFFASGSDGAGKTMAKAFSEANFEKGYAYYNDIFMRSKAANDFKGTDFEKGTSCPICKPVCEVKIDFEDVGKPAMAASKALALWAKNPIVFNSANGKSHLIQCT